MPIKTKLASTAEPELGTAQPQIVFSVISYIINIDNITKKVDVIFIEFSKIFLYTTNQIFMIYQPRIQPSI